MAYFPRWYYDTNKGKCEPFIYGGCMANANNFKTKDKCEETCSGIRNKLSKIRHILMTYIVYYLI